MTCRICNTHFDDSIFIIKEKMFGTSEEFEYTICPACQCLQIIEIPAKMHEHYPANYYSFRNSRKGNFKREIKQKLYNILSFIKNDFHKKPSFLTYGITYPDRNKEILDVGCGDGKLLFEMKKFGFNKLTGIDPFLKDEIKSKNLKLFKADIEDVKSKFDIIMSHHSLEHMSDPNRFFSRINDSMNTNGRLILRVPIYPNYIWDKYGVDWIQLDAPRHLYTFSLFSISYLCEKNQLAIKNVKYDAQPWALASTEYCLNGNSHIEFTKNVLISESQTLECMRANENNYGDSVCLTIVIKK